MDYLIYLLNYVGIYAILAVSLDLVVGYTGLISLAHAGFWGIGGYGTAIMMVTYKWSFLPAVAVGILVAMVAAIAIGLVMSRFRGDYYTLCSLAFTVIAGNIFLNWEWMTRGSLGIPGIPRPEILGFRFGTPDMYIVLVTILLFAVVGVAQYLTNSSFGRVLKAIREDERAIEVFGYRVEHYKLAIFTVSAGMAAIAGGLFATYLTLVDPTSFTLSDTIFFLAIIIVGGLANVRGALIGALILTLLPEALRFVGFPADIAGQMRQVLYGVLLVLMMLYRPRGILGEYKL